MAAQKKGAEILGIASGIDITQQKLAEMNFREMAQQDDLTRLANRNYFLERLNYIVQLVVRSKVKLNAALFLIDVSDLRNINEDFGLVMGDRVLQTIAARIQSAAQSLDVVARVTGGKFGFIYRESELAPRSVDEQAELLVKLFSEPVALGIRYTLVNVHIGIAPITDNYTMTDTLLRDAEVALQAAKDTEPERWAIYDANMDSKAKRERELSIELKAAVDTAALQFYYQPIIDIKNQRLVGFESLCRWQRKDGEWVSPGEFIPLAERFGLVLKISLLAIIRAGQQIQHWRQIAQDDSLYISVNVDAQSLVSDELLAALDNAKARFQLKPGQLKLELTEHALMENPKDFLPRLNAISSGGFPLMLDDFGTGYSSLSYLHQMPIAIMKIDRSFVAKILEPQTEAIVKSIIALASSLNISIVCEGIETKEQSEKLLELGCQVMQGFYFAKPMPAVDIDRLVSFASFSGVKNLA
jgi:diguanylate cyclase (GGDEF)-like protein